MARRHYGKAILSQTNVHYDQWMDTLRAEGGGMVSKDHLHRVAKSVTQKCDPSQYLLSHATIVSSVDTYQPRGAKLGKNLLHGSEIDVRFPDFRVKPETHKYINNNKDAFSRGILLTTYKTFVGAQNYLEHIQVPELSKGFIVDAIARDLGDTVYIDILVATSRIHTQLVADIVSGKLDSMSMGTISLFTICSKCGNVASDDASICPCVSYLGKGSMFQDEDGVEHPIVELIGHASIPNSNQFIEASWVGNPAFRGATRRNLLNPESTVSPERMAASQETARQRSIQVPDISNIWKSASLRTADETEESGPAPDEEMESGVDDAEGGEADDTPSDSGSGSSESSPDEVQKLVDEATQALTQKLLQSILDNLGPKPEDVTSVTPGPKDLETGNDSLQHASFVSALPRVLPKNAAAQRRAAAIHGKLASATTGKNLGLTFRDLVFYTYVRQAIAGRRPDPRMFNVVAALGRLDKFPSLVSYFAHFEHRLARTLSPAEKKSVLFCVRTASMCDR